MILHFIKFAFGFGAMALLLIIIGLAVAKAAIWLNKKVFKVGLDD